MIKTRSPSSNIFEHLDPLGCNYNFSFTIKYNNIGDMKSPPKCEIRVVVTLVDKSAFAILLNTRLTLKGGGMQ